MFKVLERHEGQGGLFRLVVETDDPSQFDLVHLFSELVEFNSILRYKSKVQKRINVYQATEPLRRENARVERVRALELYEETEGSSKEKIHYVWNYFKSTVNERLTLDSVIGMLRLARDERKKSA